METLASPLVLTKLHVPAVRPRHISRPRLVDLLASDNGASLILVCASAGYGKTTLLAEWAQSLMKNGTAVAWYALDPGDDDPLSFISYLIAGFTQALGPTLELTQIAQLLRSSPEMDLQRILPVVINAVISSKRECVLILDDYHLIGSPAIHSAMVYLLEHLPENLRIAIGSRSDPPLPLARLRARGQLLEIRTGGLRFKADETTQFLNGVMGLGLTPEGLVTLEERTEGWIAGLQLVALSLSDRADKERFIASFTGSHRYLVEYLMEEVVNRQPEGVQTFLLSTSILERMCAPLCDELAGKKEQEPKDTSAPIPVDSQAILEHLEKSNLFLVPLDDEQTWYRYHHLFRLFLQARLNKVAPQRISMLHRVACEWLAAHEFLREAAYHAFQSRDWEYAAAFVERHCFTLIVHGEISTLYEWCSAFPEEVMQIHSLLCVMQALALAYRFRRQNRPKVEARLHQAGLVLPALEDKQLVRLLTEFTADVRTFQAMAPDPVSDPRELLSIARGMLENYPEGDPGQFNGLLLTGYAYLALNDAHAADHAFETARQIALCERLFLGFVEATFHLTRLAHSQGQLHRATEICRQGQADIAALLAQPEIELPALGSLDVALGWVLMDQDRLDEAEGYLCHGLDLMGGGMNPYSLMTAYVALFRLCEIQGRPAEALRYLDRLEVAWPDIDFYTSGLRYMHSLRTAPDDPGTLADVENWCHTFSSSFAHDAPPPGMGPFGAAEVYYLAYLEWVRAQIVIGKAQTVMPYLARQLDLASANGLTGRLIELSLLEAQAWRAEGQEGRARAALERAFAAAGPAGYVRIFNQGSEAFSLRKEDLASRSIQTLYGESLSERELEVLHLIAQGATNNEIAERLVITVGTVKSHINHILGKLDSHNRTEAVAQARKLGLLKI
jgi:LuxR family maltose regulon positive regulatory protein